MIENQYAHKVTQGTGENIFLITIDLSLVFCATFSGEKTLNGVPLFFIFWSIILVLRRNFILWKSEILAQIITTCILSPIFFQVYKYSFEYYFGAISAILYINVIVFGTNIIERLLSNIPGSKLARWLPAIALILLGILTGLISGNSQRQSLVFGPNVYYRIIGTIFFLHLVMFHKNCHEQKGKNLIYHTLTTIICLLVTLFILVKTGSRGAIIVGAIILISFLYSLVTIKLKPHEITIIGILNLLSVFIIQSSLSSTILDSRAFWFYDRGSSSSSLAARGEFLHNFSSFFIKDNYLWGEGSEYIFSYPHNLYLDLLYNAGIFPFLVFLIFTLIYARILWQEKTNHSAKILTLLFLPIYIGSLFSGTIYDNYPILSLLIMLPIWAQNQANISRQKKL